MSHVRKEIRKVLNDMGFDNNFLICNESLDGHYRNGEPLVVTIRNWSPHPDALVLKKKMQHCTPEGCVEVRFQMGGACG